MNNECTKCNGNPCDKKSKVFPSAVIEIDNPPVITNIRKVVIPVSMGDDTTVPPAIGKYHNVLLYYEANSKSYLYSSDGIPTLLTGAQGEQGPAGTVTVGTTTTGEPGSSASVENVGTPENAVLNFTVPQGPRVPEKEVQEEIDNKLDAMAEGGTLGALFGGDGLEVGSDSKVKVKAGAGINVNSDGVNVSPLYINDITVTETEFTYNDTKTTIYYSIIPSTYKPKMVMSDPSNPNVGKHAYEFDYEYKPTLMTNLSPWDTSDHTTYGPLIIDNVVKVENNLSGGTDWVRTILGIDDDGVLHSINGTTAASDVNMKYACRAWYTLYNQGVATEVSSDTRAPRTFLAQNSNGDYLIGVSGGRTGEDTGMLYSDIVRFVNTVANFNSRVIFGLDGGGSSNMLYHGIRQNALVGREDRICPTWLVWTNDNTIDSGIYKSQSLNNQANIQTIIDANGHRVTASTIQGLAGENITIENMSSINKINPRTVNYSIIFKYTGETNLLAFSDILTNLPHTYGNQYFLGFRNDTYETAPFQLKTETGYSRIRNVKQLVPNVDYTIHVTLPTDTMY